MSLTHPNTTLTPVQPPQGCRYASPVKACGFYIGCGRVLREANSSWIEESFKERPVVDNFEKESSNIVILNVLGSSK